MALAFMVLQTAAGTLNVSDLTRVYARRLAIEDATMMDIGNTPRLAIDLAWPTTTLGLAYAPRLLWVDVLGSDPSPAVLLHDAGLRLSWRRPRYTLSFAQTAAIGEQNFARGGFGGSGVDPTPTTSPTPTPDGAAETPPALDLLPRPAVVSVAAAESSANLRHDLSRRWRSEVQAAFGISGGADAEARQFLPQQRTTRLDTALDFRRSRRDELGTGLSLAQIRTSNGYDHWLASLMETWSVSFPAESGGEIGLGAAFQDTTGPASTESTAWLVIGTASAWHVLRLHETRIRLQGDVGYRPDVNVLSGRLQKRLFMSAQGSLMLERSSVRLVLGTAQTFPRDAPDAAEVVSADLAFDYELFEWLSLELGGQITRQRVSGAGAPAAAGSRWLLYSGLQARAPEARF